MKNFRKPKPEGLSRAQSLIWDAISVSNSTIEKIAHKAGVSRNSIKLYVRGKAEPKAENFFAIMDTVVQLESEFEKQMHGYEQWVDERKAV